MDVREKLVELLKEVSYDQKLGWYDLWDMRDGAEDIADWLISHGVTVQEWISVKDRLPTAEDALTDGSVYAYTKAKKVLVLHYQYVCRRSDYIICWMPITIPQPPKEVEQ